MDSIFLTGLFGSIVLVTGAAWPSPKSKILPIKSVKNWLFAIGAVIMFVYSYLGYQQGGPVFFVLLEALVIIASILGMMNMDDRIDATIISVSGFIFIIWSFYLFKGYNTIFFILGLIGIGLGNAFDIGSLRRDIALTVGSAIIALFSYLEASWIFFWLNVFFAIFSGYYLMKNLHHGRKHKK